MKAMPTRKLYLLGILSILILTGCNAGKNSILFATKTSIAVDIDSNPPTFDVGYGRYEGSIAPVVESGQVLPLLSSMAANAGISSTVFGSGVTQNFSLGNAALLMSSHIGSVDNPATGFRPNFGEMLSNPASVKGTIAGGRRYFFGTRTNLGFTTGFAPERSYAPDSISLGYKRKELAYVPIRTVGDSLSIPSLIATSGISTDAGTSSGGFSVSQFYATGQAATYLAAVPAIRNTVFSAIAKDDVLQAQLLAQLQQATIASISVEDDARRRAWEIIDRAQSQADYDAALASMIQFGVASNTDAFQDEDGDSDIDNDDRELKLRALTQPFNEDEVIALNLWIEAPGF